MIVRFIAHAGIAIEEDGHTLLIDPWFRDSNVEIPILEGLTGSKTIDFQIPKTAERIDDYSPHAILLSHFHAHHAPKKDILHLLNNTFHNIILAHPTGQGDTVVKESLKDLDHVKVFALKDRESFIVGPYTITPLSHTVEKHFAWSVKTKTGHILHIADAAANKNLEFNKLDSLWDSFMDLNPHIVFISAGRNSLRIKEKNEHSIQEAAALSPIQAARLMQKIKPRIVTSMGNQNHSIWKNFIEYIPETSATEEEFRWALEWLQPQTKFIPIRPGHTFAINEITKKEYIYDTYIVDSHQL